MIEHAWLREISEDTEYTPSYLTEELPVSQAGEAGRHFIKVFDRLDDSAVRKAFRLVEQTLKDGDEEERSAAATGFLEAVLNAWDTGFDLRSIWPYVGPESRKYCLWWNEFTGVPTPEWMRAADVGSG
ncbi:DUF7674 family protein [Actinokineospora terrae]|uniref:DUF7674 domain-containing protein n=1 Tax=Actinokineospora terrae TaxID=155974 RepID=A0A1H9MQG4_9PSEU|nr:hypothetical protein [Actinokineospora terrae]SER25954.1 hypothetical protein SAMN04487818_102282 [Actinokineospora terrae]